MMRELLARMAAGGTLSQAALELGLSEALLADMLARMEGLGYVARGPAGPGGSRAGSACGGRWGCAGCAGCAGCGASRALGEAPTIWSLTDKGRKAAALPQ